MRRRLRVPRNRPRAMADDGITFDANYQIRILDADKFKATEALQGQAGEFVAKVRARALTPPGAPAEVGRGRGLRRGPCLCVGQGDEAIPRREPRRGHAPAAFRWR